MIEAMDHLPTTEAAVTALPALAAEYAHEIEVGHDIGADQTPGARPRASASPRTRTARSRTRPSPSSAESPG